MLIIAYGANDARYGLVATRDLLAPDSTWRGAVREILIRFETFKLMRRVIFETYDPFRRPERTTALVESVPLDRYKDNLRTLVVMGRERGIESVLLSVCAVEPYELAMRDVAEELHLPFVSALRLFVEKADDLRDYKIYPDETRYYERIYGRDAMVENWRLLVTTDGCHPNRAGHNLIADALMDAVDQALARRGTAPSSP